MAMSDTGHPTVVETVGSIELTEKENDELKTDVAAGLTATEAYLLCMLDRCRRLTATNRRLVAALEDINRITAETHDGKTRCFTALSLIDQIVSKAGRQ